MKKSDLKVGMIIVTRDGNDCMIIESDFNELNLYNKFEGATNIEMQFDLNLISRWNKNNDIMKVYNENGNLIWERELWKK